MRHQTNYVLTELNGNYYQPFRNNIYHVMRFKSLIFWSYNHKYGNAVKVNHVYFRHDRSHYKVT